MGHHPLLVYRPSGTAGMCKKVIGEPNNKIQAKFRVYANLEAFGIYACWKCRNNNGKYCNNKALPTTAIVICQPTMKRNVFWDF